MENKSDHIAKSRQSEPDAKLCRTCSKDKPYPESFITSYLKMIIGRECSDCRKLRKKNYNKNSLGKTEKSLAWRNSISMFYHSSSKPKKSKEEG